LARSLHTSHVTRTPLSRSKGQRSRSCAMRGPYCGGFPHSFFKFSAGYSKFMAALRL